MDNKDQEKEIGSFEFDNENNTNDYKDLVKKLKSISESISLLEKNFSDKET